MNVKNRINPTFIIKPFIIELKKDPDKYLSPPEATIGFEPMIRVLQTRALPLGYVAI